MASLKPIFLHRHRHWLAYAAAVGIFLWFCAQFYLPGQGFTSLVMFGSRSNVRYLPELRALNHYEQEDTYGYDAQHYAQIAMRPSLTDSALQAAVDSLPYRARRILFCWTAYLLARGDPARALHIYAVQNIVCWLLLGVLLLRWFPAVNWGNFGRWCGVMFSYGLCFSVRGALVDGPSLLLIAVGVALAETGRNWWSAAVLGVAGLGKETNLLGVAALAPAKDAGGRAWTIFFLRCVFVLLPLAVWCALIWHWLGSEGVAGLRNFGAPFFAYAQKWRDTAVQLAADGLASPAKWSLLTLLALTAQFLFFVLQPKWSDPWWRVAVAYSLLMVFLGEAVWEGYPGAASRVLLPMTLAFNILVPRGRVGWGALLVVGNLMMLVSLDAVSLPARQSYHVAGPRALLFAENGGRTIEAIFDGQWYRVERSWLEYWRWSKGPASVTLRNSQPFALRVGVSFDLRAADARTVLGRSGAQDFFRRTLQPGEQCHVELESIRLGPGDTVLTWETDRPAIFPGGSAGRPIAFSLRNLNLKLLGRADEEPRH